MSSKSTPWLCILILISLLFPSGTLTAGPLPSPSASTPTVPPIALDAELQNAHGRLSLVLELQDPPVAQIYAAALEQTGNTPALARLTQAHLARLESAQQKLLPALAALDAQILYRTQRAYNGIAISIDAAYLPELQQLPGILAIHTLHLKTLNNTSSVPLIGTPNLWNPSGWNIAGEGIDIGIIDTGIDYLHTDFGGPGTSAYTVNDTTVITDTYQGQLLFPNAKVVGGWDFVGDAYDALSVNITDTVPQPDPDPSSCLSSPRLTDHGTHMAGTTAGYGVKTDGTVYTGTYTGNLDFSQFRIGPGVAPKARLYALRIFGCNSRATALADAALEWALDPNDDGNLEDHLDVINLALGSPFGIDYDSTAAAADNAALAGMIVVAAVGNNGDTYFIADSPSIADRAVSVAASRDAGILMDGFMVNTPAAIAGLKPGTFAGAFNWMTTTLPLTQTLVYPDPGTNPLQDQRTGCYTFDVTNTARISGKIVLLDWNEPSCGNSNSRVGLAAAAGAKGVLLVDNGGLFDLWIAGNPLIPALGLPQSIGDELKAHLAETITLTFDRRYAGQGLFNDPNQIDTRFAASSRGPRRDGTLKPDITAPGETIFSADGGSGSQGINLSGTSAAAAHVAGTLALLKQLHPTWTVEELKALLMNTAEHDLHTDPPASSRLYTPAQVGAGRLDAALAAQSHIVLYNADAPGAVNVSFGFPEVTGLYTASHAVRVTNHGTQTVSYLARYSPRADMPGVNYSVTPASFTVPGSSTITLTVVLTADAARMQMVTDPLYDWNDYRYIMNEESGYITLLAPYKIYLPVVLRKATPTAQTLTTAPSGITAAAEGNALRLPVYAAPRVASDMHAVQTTFNFTATTATTFISLTGTGFNGTDVPTEALTLISAFELQEISPDEITSTGNANIADLKYLGITSDYGAVETITDTTLYFAIATQTPHATPNEVQFSIYLDTNNDGSDDYILYNSTQGGSSPNDEFVTRLYDLSQETGTNVEYLNGIPGGFLHTAVYNTNLMILPVQAYRLGINPLTPTLRYHVNSYSRETGLIDPVDTSAPHVYHPAQPGLDFNDGIAGSPVRPDYAGATLPLSYHASGYTADQALGILLFHHHNLINHHTEIISVTQTLK